MYDDLCRANTKLTKAYVYVPHASSQPTIATKTNSKPREWRPWHVGCRLGLNPKLMISQPRHDSNSQSQCPTYHQGTSAKVELIVSQSTCYACHRSQAHKVMASQSQSSVCRQEVAEKPTHCSNCAHVTCPCSLRANHAYPLKGRSYPGGIFQNQVANEKRCAACVCQTGASKKRKSRLGRVNKMDHVTSPNEDFKEVVARLQDPASYFLANLVKFVDRLRYKPGGHIVKSIRGIRSGTSAMKEQNIPTSDNNDTVTVHRPLLSTSSRASGGDRRFEDGDNLQKGLQQCTVGSKTPSSERGISGIAKTEEVASRQLYNLKKIDKISEIVENYYRLNTPRKTRNEGFKSYRNNKLNIASGEPASQIARKNTNMCLKNIAERKMSDYVCDHESPLIIENVSNIGIGAVSCQELDDDKSPNNTNVERRLNVDIEARVKAKAMISHISLRIEKNMTDLKSHIPQRDTDRDRPTILTKDSTSCVEQCTPSNSHKHFCLLQDEPTPNDSHDDNACIKNPNFSKVKINLSTLKENVSRRITNVLTPNTNHPYPMMTSCGAQHRMALQLDRPASCPVLWSSYEDHDMNCLLERDLTTALTANTNIWTPVVSQPRITFKATPTDAPMGNEKVFVFPLPPKLNTKEIASSGGSGVGPKMIPLDFNLNAVYNKQNGPECGDVPQEPSQQGPAVQCQNSMSLSEPMTKRMGASGHGDQPEVQTLPMLVTMATEIGQGEMVLVAGSVVGGPDVGDGDGPLAVDKHQLETTETSPRLTNTKLESDSWLDSPIVERVTSLKCLKCVMSLKCVERMTSSKYAKCITSPNEIPTGVWAGGVACAMMAVCVGAGVDVLPVVRLLWEVVLQVVLIVLLFVIVFVALEVNNLTETVMQRFDGTWLGRLTRFVHANRALVNLERRSPAAEDSGITRSHGSGKQITVTQITDRDSSCANNPILESYECQTSAFLTKSGRPTQCSTTQSLVCMHHKSSISDQDDLGKAGTNVSLGTDTMICGEFADVKPTNMSEKTAVSVKEESCQTIEFDLLKEENHNELGAKEVKVGAEINKSKHVDKTDATTMTCPGEDDLKAGMLPEVENKSVDCDCGVAAEVMTDAILSNHEATQTDTDDVTLHDQCGDVTDDPDVFTVEVPVNRGLGAADVTDASVWADLDARKVYRQIDKVKAKHAESMKKMRRKFLAIRRRCQMEGKAMKTHRAQKDEILTKLQLTLPELHRQKNSLMAEREAMDRQCEQERKKTRDLVGRLTSINQHFYRLGHQMQCPSTPATVTWRPLTPGHMPQHPPPPPPPGGGLMLPVTPTPPPPPPPIMMTPPGPIMVTPAEAIAHDPSPAAGVPVCPSGGSAGVVLAPPRFIPHHNPAAQHPAPAGAAQPGVPPPMVQGPVMTTMTSSRAGHKSVTAGGQLNHQIVQQQPCFVQLPQTHKHHQQQQQHNQQLQLQQQQAFYPNTAQPFPAIQQHHRQQHQPETFQQRIQQQQQQQKQQQSQQQLQQHQQKEQQSQQQQQQQQQQQRLPIFQLFNKSDVDGGKQMQQVGQTAQIHKLLVKNNNQQQQQQ